MKTFNNINLICFLIVSSLIGCEKTTEEIPMPPKDEPCETSVTDIEGNTYKVVKIGTRCWMAENLRTTQYPDGALISEGDNAFKLWKKDDAKFYFNYDTTYQSEYPELFDLLYTKSKLYTWAAATNLQSDGSKSGINQGVCPDGWHLPNKSDWEELINQTGIYNTARDLKSANPLHWERKFPEKAGTDLYEFNSIASGGRGADDGFHIIGVQAFYWSSSTVSGQNWSVWTPHLTDGYSEILWVKLAKTNSFCIRCIQNQ